MNREQQETIATFDVRSFFKRWPKFYFFIATVFGPMMFCGLSAKGFLKLYPKEGKTLNLGSGPRTFPDPSLVNVDIHPYKSVNMVVDITAVPLPSGSVSRIICDNVLEHVARPNEVVLEIHRLLVAGGVAYISTPFLYPFHSSPNDYQRWTAEGLKELFRDFEIVEIGVRAGPFSALTVHLSHVAASIFSFGSIKGYSLLVNIFMLVFLPIKLLDLVFNYWPNAHTVAAVLYCVIKKRA